MKTYFVTASSRSADAFSIVQRVNEVTSSNGDSIYKERVQEELDRLADAEKQEVYGLKIEAETVEIDE